MCKITCSQELPIRYSGPHVYAGQELATVVRLILSPWPPLHVVNCRETFQGGINVTRSWATYLPADIFSPTLVWPACTSSGWITCYVDNVNSWLNEDPFSASKRAIQIMIQHFVCLAGWKFPKWPTTLLSGDFHKTRACLRGGVIHITRVWFLKQINILCLSWSM